LPGSPRCRVPGHAGLLHFGTASGGRPVVVFEGRVHLYEGATLGEVTFAVRLLGRLGARAVMLSSAAGAVNPAYQPGELVLVTDHINLTGEDPARLHAFGTKPPLFPSRTQVYEPRLLEAASALAFQMGLHCRQGVLAA